MPLLSHFRRYFHSFAAVSIFAASRQLTPPAAAISYFFIAADADIFVLWRDTLLPQAMMLMLPP